MDAPTRFDICVCGHRRGDHDVACLVSKAEGDAEDCGCPDFCLRYAVSHAASKPQSVVDDLRALLFRTKDEQRVELLGELFNGFCTACGAFVDSRICHCTNDE